MLPVSARGSLGRTSPTLRAGVVIPARYQSTRLPGKPLADLAGEPMVVHVYRRALAAPGVGLVVVATDDDRVAQVVRDAGGTAIMTSSGHRTGTERVAEVASLLDCEIIVNVQGDEPFVHPEMITATIEGLEANPAASMSTVCRAMGADEDWLNPNVVKVARDLSGHALYFSRSPIPHLRGPRPTIWKHFGLYAYRRQFLLDLAALPPTPLEQAESLEQLRALEHGYRIFVALTEHDSIGVDTPEDLQQARQRIEPARAQT